MAIARDGTGALVYLRNDTGAAHVFVSLLRNGAFQPPQQVDTGLAGASSQPVVAVTNNGLTQIAFVNAGTLYTVGTANLLSPFTAPVALAGGASNPSLSLSTYGKGYLAFTANGASDSRPPEPRCPLRGAAGRPVDGVQCRAGPEPSRRCGRRDRPSAGGLRRRRHGDRQLGRERPHLHAPRARHHPEHDRSAGRPVELRRRQTRSRPTCPWSAPAGTPPTPPSHFTRSWAAAPAPIPRAGQPATRSRFDGVSGADGLTTPGGEGASNPAVAVAEYGAGLITAAGDTSHNLFATALGSNDQPGGSSQVNSLAQVSAPDAVPATAGTVSTLIAWQQDSGAGAPAEIRIRYAPDGVDLNPEQVVSTPDLGPTNAAVGLAAGGDISGDAAIAWVQGSGASTRIVAAQLFQGPGGSPPRSDRPTRRPPSRSSAGHRRASSGARSTTSSRSTESRSEAPRRRPWRPPPRCCRGVTPGRSQPRTWPDSPCSPAPPRCSWTRWRPRSNRGSPVRTTSGRR